MKNNFEKILNVLKKDYLNNYKILSNKNELICHTPQIAPQAWLHEIYYKLNNQEILDLESKIGKKMPEEYKAFLLMCNGINIFSDSLSIFGVRKSYKRIGDEAHQPYDLYEMNNENRNNINKNNLIIGSCDDNNNFIVYNLEENNICIYNRDNYNIIEKFNSLIELLEKKIEILSK